MIQSFFAGKRLGRLECIRDCIPFRGAGLPACNSRNSRSGRLGSLLQYLGLRQPGLLNDSAVRLCAKHGQGFTRTVDITQLGKLDDPEFNADITSKKIQELQERMRRMGSVNLAMYVSDDVTAFADLEFAVAVMDGADDAEASVDAEGYLHVYAGHSN